MSKQTCLISASNNWKWELFGAEVKIRIINQQRGLVETQEKQLMPIPEISISYYSINYKKRKRKMMRSLLIVDLDLECDKSSRRSATGSNKSVNAHIPDHIWKSDTNSTKTLMWIND